ncbi:MAG: NVEALA domain-containing protein [Phocaeicola sp.]|nr:NVEALA domain-containing protein [Phocaeicola sp.]
MKKRILKIVFASAFVLVAGYSVYASQQNAEMSDLALANVEALAGGESSGSCRWKRVKDNYGCTYHVCVSNGDGDICACGSTNG